MTKKSKANSTPKAAKSAPSERGSSVSTSRRVLGAVFLSLSVLMSLLLVLEHFGGMSLPGCGEGGPCEQAANSLWGKIRVGGFEWPVSFLGLAYFLAALVAWLAGGRSVSRAFRFLVRAGALISLGFVLIIVLESTFCPYCVAAHVGNFAFWATVESLKAPAIRSRLRLYVIGVVFASVTLVLGLVNARFQETVRQEAESQRAAATQSIIDRAQEPIQSGSERQGAGTWEALREEYRETADPSEETTTEAPIATVSPTKEDPEPEPTPEVATDEPSPPSGPAFTGRYRIGPEKAPIRIVMFTDYQCRDCYRIEQELRNLHGQRNDLSISIKHFPFNADCNPYIGRTIHPNACWAARAAEAAGILWGPEGFWKMHVWLFEQRGVFQSTQALEGAIREMGYDPTGFASVMSGEETLAAVRADAEEGKRLGLFFTPMIFINGVELKGWNAPNALTRTVEEVAAINPPARSPLFDRPPQAFQKYIDDWRDQPLLELPSGGREWSYGAANPRIEVVLWGDYQEPGTGEADAIIRSLVDARDDARYSYRHFPFNSDCNPKLQDRRHPEACRAAQAAEAAGLIGGDAAFWKMHVWLMENRTSFNDETLRQAATSMGLDSDSLMSLMAEPASKANILADIRSGGQLPVLRHGMPAGIYGVPAIFINGRFVPRWKLDDRPVLKEIIEAAAHE